MSFYVKHIHLLKNRSELDTLPDRKTVISTLNAHSYNLAQKDGLFAKSLTYSDVLIPDGASIVMAVKWLTKNNLERVAGWDLFIYEMEKLNRKGGVCFFLGSSVKVLELILKKTSVDYPNIRMIGYSPRYRTDFTNEENKAMIDEIHAAKPDLILIGMTAPKQEKWVFLHRDQLQVNCHICAIGAVFDFYAGTLKRAPLLWQKNGLEWLYRLIMEPRRMWKRYIIGNFLFLFYIFKEKYFVKSLLPVISQPEITEQTAKTHPSAKKPTKRKTGFLRILLYIVVIAAGIGGFFLYPHINPMMNPNKLPDNAKVTAIEDTNPVQADEIKEDTLNNNDSISLPDDKISQSESFKTKRDFGEGKWVLIIGSFPTKTEADNYSKKLQTAGIEYEIINIGNKLFRISIAGFDDKNEAEKYAKQMKSNPYCGKIWVAKR